MPQFGWTIQLTRCAYLDPGDASREAYAVNLVMPWSDDSIVSAGRGPALPVPTAPRDRSLLQPWTWEDTLWQVHARPVAGAWQAVGAPLALATGTAAGPLPAKGIGDEMLRRTAGCDHAFSVSPDDIDAKGENRRSLPHALAPLTHWPAGASNHGLRMAGFLLLDPASLDPLGPDAEVVCFPQLRLDGDAQTLVPDTPATSAAYGCELAAYADDPGLVMACRACSRAEPDWQQHRSQPDGVHDEVPRALVRFNAARALTPLAVLIRAAAELETKADGPEGTPAAREYVEGFAAAGARRTSWTEALWRLAPNGWEAPEVDAAGKLVYDRHVLARLMPSSQAAQLAQSGFTPTPTALKGAIELLGERKPREGWSPDNQRTWQGAGLAYNDLFNDSGTALPLARGLRYLRAWLQVARAIHEQDSARQLMGPWLALASVLPAADPEQAGDALTAEKLGNTIATESMVNAAALGLLSTLPVWEWIDAPSSSAADRLAALLLDPRPPTAGPANPSPGATVASLLADYPDAATFIEGIAAAFVAGVARSANPATARPRDPGLVLRFESSDPGGDFDQSVRGYAVALCAYLRADDGKGWLGDQQRAQWITDTAVLHYHDGRRDWLTQADGHPWWLHETIGSTAQDGVRASQAEYVGKPISVMSADKAGNLLDKDPLNEDPDGSEVIDFLWHTERALPLLGYGLHYKAVVSCIDNAGGVVESDLRDARLCAQLVAPAKVFPEMLPALASPRMLESAPQWHYRSAVPPGAPRAVNDIVPEAYAFSDDTRAHAFQVDALRQEEVARTKGLAVPAPGGAPLARIALLAHKQQVDAKPLFGAEALFGPYTFTLEPPAASAEFVERWLNTDIVLLERLAAGQAPLGALSDPAFAGAKPEALADFRSRITDEIARNAAEAAYNPALSAIGVAVWVNGDPKPAIAQVYPLALTRRDTGSGRIDLAPKAARQVKVLVLATDAAAAGAPEVSPPGADQWMKITVAAGSFVQVRAFSLVSGDHFAPAHADSADQRFYSGIELASGPDVPEFAGKKAGAAPYRAFGPSEFWIETAPRWEDHAASFNLSVLPPGARQSSAEEPLPPDLLALKCDAPGRAAWVRSLFVQRHEWHWTGYPVRLPQGGALQDWLVSFAGVESYREANEIVLQTGFKSGEWRYGPNASGVLVLQKKTLQQGTRPARYAAFTARPMVRFRKWLNPQAASGPLALERQVFAAGEVIPGIAPAAAGERLAAPPLRWAVPLTATYTAAPQGGVKPERISCGNLLVIDDALRRTDQLSRLGGIADTLEIDLLETREKGFDEIGVNPIFHGNLSAAERAQLKLRQHPPFGLTHDNSANALVSQTAVVVTVDNGGGKWLLAKIRARRLILPEALMNSALVAEAQQRAGGPASFVLPTRIEGEDAVPLDFALDLDVAAGQPRPGPIGPRFGIVINPQGSDQHALSSALPDAGEPGNAPQLRYLCSWHKRRWAGAGAPAWRLQVLAQRRNQGELDWRTVDKLSGFQNPASELPAGVQVRQVRLTLPEPVRYIARSVRMSDYTDPMWLTFIGSFGRERTGHPEQYRCIRTGNGLGVQALDGAAAPVLNGLESTDPCFHVLFVYRPLVDITRGDARNDTGALVGVYYYSSKPGAGVGGFREMKIDAGLGPVSLAGCYAYLCAVQRISSPSSKEAKVLREPEAFKNFEGFVDQLFPAAGECTMRLLPEYIGPIAASEPAA